MKTTISIDHIPGTLPGRHDNLWYRSRKQLEQIKNGGSIFSSR